MLTLAQAETLNSLINRSYVDHEFSFTPQQAFPGRDNADNGKRRCITALAKKGLLEKVDPIYEVYRADPARCWAAWDEWRDKNPDVEFWN